METKVVLFFIHLTLGIISSIIYLIYCYKKYEVLTLADIIASLLILFGWPIVLLALLGKFNILPKAITRTEIDEIAKKLKPYGIIIP